MAPYGQVVIGHPGCGKSTYCNGMNQFLNSIGRMSFVINLDPANDRLPYDVEIDIRDYITLEEIMDQEGLGPNGGLIYALEIFGSKINLFTKQIKKLINDKESCYLIFDCPGQVELFTNNDVFNHLFNHLVKELDMRLCVVSLVDCINIIKPSQYISILLLTLRSMLQLDLPQVNIFSKIDLLKNLIEQEVYKDGDDDDEEFKNGLPFDLNYYTQVQDLSYLLPYLNNEENNYNSCLQSKLEFNKNYNKLTKAISELIEDFGLISFEVLSIEDKKSMINILSIIDKANGYVFGTNELGGDNIWQSVLTENKLNNNYIDIQERWVDEKEKYDSIELKERSNLLEKLQQKPLDVEQDYEQALKEWQKITK
ncbi:hypothetical protein PACTADRAFT_76317 [Pachysolen tannophilus NRRL Y-2460]|uniref:GPN-loop GTPase 2 n=1 Tax=Pachysolen tannophilus NRRL Y-2460 TaxID=669874 RepID=A0A1E4TSG8_PACTA|nr:hypothetical protein PACTADRAFT_76317 [Pachysolen tannophilus NRRL Y-2460]